MTVRAALEVARSLLFVPGNRPERFSKALDAGADGVVFDLEDAVPPALKDQAREDVVAAIAHASIPVVVRINAADTRWHVDDVRAVIRAGAHIMLPKTEAPWMVEAMGIPAESPIGVIALIETPVGVLNAVQIARSASVVRLAFGSLDFAASLGIDPERRDALLAARSHLVLASAAHGLPGPIDGVTQAVRDDSALESDLSYAKALGFTAKLCIHPGQVAGTHRAFAPTEQDLDWAGRILSAAGGDSAAQGGVVVVDGRMIDAPVVKRAQMIQAAGALR